MKYHQKTRVDPGPTLYLLGSDYLQVKMMMATMVGLGPWKYAHKTSVSQDFAQRITSPLYQQQWRKSSLSFCDHWDSSANQIITNYKYLMRLDLQVALPHPQPLNSSWNSNSAKSCVERGRFQIYSRFQLTLFFTLNSRLKKKKKQTEIMPILPKSPVGHCGGLNGIPRKCISARTSEGDLIWK